MKPFDLEKALSGEPVVTRDGRPVKIAGYNPDAIKSDKLSTWIHGKAVHFYEDGMWDTRESDYDLFMVEPPKVKKEGWINIYEDNPGRFPGKIWETEKEAFGFNSSVKKVATIKIEWEE